MDKKYKKEKPTQGYKRIGYALCLINNKLLNFRQFIFRPCDEKLENGTSEN